MKKISLLLIAIWAVFVASATDINHLRQLGLPTKAVPASLYFENYYEATPRAMTENDINKSSVFGLGEEYSLFVEALPSNEDDLYTKVNIWMYDTEKDKVTKIFSQEGEEYEELLIKGFDWIFDKQASFKDVVISDSKQKISVQEFKGYPIVILQAEIFTGFMHARQVTLLVNPTTKRVKTFEDQMFVSVAHTLSNMLMMAEVENAQDYFITTSTAYHSEEQPLKETEEYIMFHKQYLTPTLHIYNAHGELVKEIDLPEDEVDMIR
ncbi:MAG: hypothetical protein IKX33_11170 [Prevotella sp.]|nr:hypothetical protein [Prevotella sp.]